MLAAKRKDNALTRSSHLYWLHYRTLEPFILRSLGQAQAPLLDLGCGDRPYRAHYPSGQAIGADVVQSSMNCVDVILRSTAELPFASNQFLTVLCTQVLEHVEDPIQLLSEAHRVLAPGGKLILTCPFVWELHERPHDYLRFTEYWLSSKLQALGYNVDYIEPQGGDLATIGQLLCMALAARRLRMPSLIQRMYNRFWQCLDRASRTNWLPLNYGVVAVKTQQRCAAA